MLSLLWARPHAHAGHTGACAPSRRHDGIELVFLGELHEPTVKLDRVNEQIDVVQPNLVARWHHISVGRYGELLLWQNIRGPVELVGDLDGGREVRHDHVDALSYQLRLARVGRRN